MTAHLDRRPIIRCGRGDGLPRGWCFPHFHNRGLALGLLGVTAPEGGVTVAALWPASAAPCRGRGAVWRPSSLDGRGGKWHSRQVNASRRPGPLALLALLVLAGCGPSPGQIANAVLLTSPVVYLMAMVIVYSLFSLWQGARPDLRFGRGSHYAGTALFLALAVLGARKAGGTGDLLPLALWFHGSCVLAWWLLLARLTLNSGWGFRWGGIVVTGLLTAPMALALLPGGSAFRDDLVGNLVLVYFFGGGLGGLALLFLVIMLIEAARVNRRVQAALNGELP